MPKSYITKKLSDLVKNRIRKLMENDSIIEIYSLICQLPQSRILLALDMALTCTFITDEIKGNTAGYTSCFLYIYIKCQNSSNSIIDEAAIVIIFLHEFTHYLRKYYSNSMLSSITDTTPLEDIYRIEEIFILKQNGQTSERNDVDAIIKKRSSSSKKWKDSGYLFERCAFGCEVDFINIESATYLMSTADFDLAYFRKTMISDHEAGETYDSYVIKRSYNRYNCITTSLIKLLNS
ncbi:hypothetical protein SteCoe_39552 [Stentor coeruleus]|uniref:Uncharacterized protein n=1 Tax=Stentor coeruleus TaxID=5963 RepID=A0A1R2AKN4_9CILI|nr:hypothetical protein SteCoe_39552 [Stentor coeruleus]